MSITTLRAVVPLICLFTYAASANAAEPTADSHSCAYKLESSERLACYDAAFPPVVDAVSRAAAQEMLRKRAIENFGLSGEQLREREPEHIRDARPDRIEATVVRVTSRATGELVLTLDNDQMWVLTESSSKGHLEPGDKVVIRSAALGSFLLSTPERISLRAKRIR